MLAKLIAGMGLLLGLSLSVDAQHVPTGDAVIRQPVGESEIVVTTTGRVAGAIHSLTWRGQEFIDSTDHGRQLQSASNLDVGGPIQAETFNPTEAGSVRDGAGPTSTSRLLHQLVGPNFLQTTTQMAFWLPPDGSSGGHAAKNTTSLSNHLLTKRVRLGLPEFPQAIAYDVTFHLPLGERHKQAVFEVVTGYMPGNFERFSRFDVPTGRLVDLSDGPGEQGDPVVLSTVDGEFAMGCIAIGADIPEAVLVQVQGPGYGRFRFPREHVVKWNCVFRCKCAEGLPAGDYCFRTVVFVGDVSSVSAMLGHFVGLTMGEFN